MSNNSNPATLVNNDISVNDAIDAMHATTSVGLVPFLAGSPAIGKSSAVMELGKRLNYKVITMFLSQMSPEDILGFPMINKETNRTDFVPPSIIPLEGLDEVPEGYDGFILFLDEINAAPLAIQAAAYSLILDKKIGQRNIHPKVLMVAAGNKLTDGAMVHPMSSALSSRMVKYQVTANLSEWQEWAINDGSKIHHSIRSYLEMIPSAFYNFQQVEDVNNCFASPRTWHMVSKLLNAIPKEEKFGEVVRKHTASIAGLVGAGVGREFINYTNIFDAFPSTYTMQTNPDSVQIPNEPSKLYALSGLLGDRVTEDSAQALMSIIVRMPKEFQVLSMRALVKKDNALLQNTHVDSWVMNNISEFN